MTKYQYGKHPAVIDERTLRLENYLTAIVPPPPLVYDVTKVMNVSVKDPAKLFPMDHNDTIGLCVLAGVAHSVTIYNGLVSNLLIPPADVVRDVYFKMTGGPDSGLNMLSTAKYWQKNGLFGEKPFAFASVNSLNHIHLMQTIKLFGCAPIGIAVQDNFIEQFDAHEPWDGSGGDTGDGHCVVLTGYDQTLKMWYLSTWGGIQAMTFDCGDKVIDEAYAVLPQEASNPQFCPGLDVTALTQDLALVQN